jgi:putative hemolysin
MGALLLLVVLNGLLAMSEIAVVSVRRLRLKQHAEAGNTRARAALALLNHPGDFLSTVQVGITLVGILAGAFSSATLAESIEPFFAGVPAFTRYAEALSVGIVVVGVTYVSLILGELVPKQIALRNPESIAMAVAPAMQWLSRRMAVVVKFLSFSTRAALRLLGVRPMAEPAVMDEDVKLLIQQGRLGGSFEAIEADVVTRLFRLSDQRISALMTPRMDIVWIDLDNDAKSIQAKMVESRHTVFPAARGSLDNFAGLVEAKNLLQQTFSGQRFDPAALLVGGVLLPESASAFEALEKLRAAHLKMAMVLDEYGGIEGLVTPYDILEALVGDFPDPEALVELESIQREDGSWLLDGRISVGEFTSLLDIRELPSGAERHFKTLGGFVMAALGRVPVAGNHFNWRGWRFEVVDMDRNRIDKVLAAPMKSVPPGRERGVQR